MPFLNKYFLRIIVVVLMSVLAFEAITTLVFSSIGYTSGSVGNYIFILHSFLAFFGAIVPTARLCEIACITNNCSLLKISQKIKPVATTLSVAIGFALLGFYYGGSLNQNNALIATISAIISAIIGIFLSSKFEPFFSIAVLPVATISAYGFAFYVGIKAIFLFSEAKIKAILWGAVCLIYIRITIVNFRSIFRDIKK